jgi:hypothetical protein
MAKKHMKKSSTSLGHKRNVNQNHVKMPPHSSTFKNTNNNKCRWGCEEKGTLIHCWWECKLVQCKLVHPLWKAVWRLLKKLKIELPYDPAIPLLGYTWRNVSQITTKAHARPCLLQHYSQHLSNGNSQKCPTTDEWIKKMWYLYTMEFYSAIKKEWNFVSCR